MYYTLDTVRPEAGLRAGQIGPHQAHERLGWIEQADLIPLLSQTIYIWSLAQARVDVATLDTISGQWWCAGQPIGPHQLHSWMSHIVG